MNITVKDTRQQDDWSRQVDIQIEGDSVKDEIERELRRLRKDVALPGFRKGKVPMGTLKARFGDDVRAEIIERTVQDAVRTTVTEQALTLVSPPRVEEIDYEDGGPLSFTAEFDIRPDVELPDYKNLHGEKVVRPVDDAAVDAVIEDVRQRRATTEPVERAIEPGDVVRADLVTLGAGRVPIVGSRQEGLRFPLIEGQIPDAWITALSGHRAGASVVVELPRPEAPESEQGVVAQGGEERYHQLEISGVESRTVPELDDAFAQDVARCESVDELRVKIRENLESEEERNGSRELERQLLDRLAEGLTLDIPERIVKQSADQLYDTALKQRPDLDEAGLERLAVDAQTEAVRRVKRELILSEIQRREEIEVSDEEATAAYEQLMRAEMEPPADGPSRERMIDNLRETMAERKVLNYVVAQADVEVIEQSRQRRIVTPFDH